MGHTARHRRTWLSLGIAMAVLVGIPGGAAAASGSGTAASRPDARVRLQKITYELFETDKYSGPWIGDDVYNTTGSGQNASVSWHDTTPGSQRWIFGVSLENDGSSSDRMRVGATGSGLNGWTVTYYDGRTNITAAVADGTFMTPSLAPGATHVIKVKITRLGDDSAMDDVRRRITAASVKNPNKVDAVRVVLKHATCGC